MENSEKGFSRKLVIDNKLGLHARPAGTIARMAASANSCVWIEKDGDKVDASSMIDIMSLACVQGTEITVGVDSPSDRALFDAIVEYISRGAS